MVRGGFRFWSHGITGRGAARAGKWADSAPKHAVTRKSRTGDAVTAVPANAADNAGIDSVYAWTRLGISLLLATIGGVGMWAVVVVLPAVQAEFGVDRAAASMPYTATMVGFAAGNVLVGRAIDRVGYWIPALVSSIALVAGFGLASLSTSIVQFTLAQGILIGAGTSAIFGPLIADISHWFNRRRGVAVATAAAGSYLAGTVWPTIITPLMKAEGWRFTYVAIGIACLVTMVPLVLMLRRGAPAVVSGSPGARLVQPISLSPTALQVLLVIAGLGCCVAMSMPQVHIVAYCMDLGYGVAHGADMLSIMMAAGVVSRLASGFIADRIGGVRTLLIGSVLQCLSLFFYIPFDGLASLYVVSLVFGLSQGGIVPCYAIIVREYMPAKEAGQRVGIVIMATIFGMAIGGWMSGWIYDLTGSYSAAFLNGIAWNLLNIIAMVLVFWKARRSGVVTV
ncbi:MFS transporter [Mesorhizobium sp. M2D.F.Ca.ET.185.01.1.1]|nr:MFS transporter [Mesorhizobium sp. M2D.F.Ca.ET.140.01.1.1]TGP21189.1 MFS transporter [Mesorhizobium sp. M2D.F.Ca.ET.233.01.1.1]TGP34285.1 MFS transporter [Mesorhizobium sp. M2D.F.Ca.ET.232.01.1.1]TGP55678.1 MFS transporter [bacterium M00.F.Ca.ET.230.01.1.1]TGP58920.1 MFS transporter [Mesorhizobium sp. M2D.F.Ca.ET.226.01.1.1]TGP67993.1 MFS transporter [Mesorhizobium sp. M2D.F.Ca.ET.225.01.1.1]TGP80506.1 MFS transporter [bacterium M00.F.Ca.ET.227.01.1.1]TGP81693.1 MFS transporter [Mesorhizo